MQNTSPHRIGRRFSRRIFTALALASLPLAVSAQSSWTGAANTDWNNAANWTAGVPSGVNAIITNISPNLCTVTSTPIATPVDILVGTGAGMTGRVDHIAGDVSTGDGNWMFIGWQGGNATYNLANTAAGGGAFTGYGTGSGNLTVGGTLLNGNLFVGLDNGTLSLLNINSSGTLTAGGLYVGANGSSTGTVNLDNGTVQIQGECQIGSSYWGNGFSGRLNMSGGTFNANILSFSRGANPSAAITGIGHFTGGTVNVGQWFTVGFAGSAASVALVTNNGATINVNVNGGGNFEMGVWDPMTPRFVLNSGAVNVCNSGSILFGVFGQSGAATFDHNGGTVTFYSDAGFTVGGFGGIVLGNVGGPNPWETSTGTFTYNLNGGTLTVPQISKVSAPATGVFNFNGGTLKPTTSLATFLQGLSSANILAGGAVIDTDGYDITIAQPLAGTGGLVKRGLGTLTLTGTNTYSGLTVISNGVLALSGSGVLASQVVIPAGRTFDVSTLSVGVENDISGTGTIAGPLTGAASMDVYPATDGTAGTLTINGDANLTGGGSLRFDLSTTASSGNDRIVVSGNLSVSSATAIRIQALAGASPLDTTTDYILCQVSGTLTMGSTPSLAWDGTPPSNYLSYTVQQVGNNLVLKYTPAVAPTVSATSTPSVVVRNQALSITATVTPGTGSVTNVFADVTQIGGSATAPLVLSSTPNVYTNTFVVGSAIVPGVKSLSVVAQANTGLSSPAAVVTNTVVATNEVWTGAGPNDNWTTANNWHITRPADSGDAVTFAGSTRLTPNLDVNLSVTGVSFETNAGAFTLGTSTASTLTLAAGTGIENRSTNTQTINLPLLMTAPQTLHAAVGTLNVAGSLDKNGNLLTVTGAANTVLSGTVSGSGSLFKRGSGTLTVPVNTTWDLNQASSGGFSGPLIAQAGRLVFNNGSFQSVNGELVIGGVITNGHPGNDATVVVDNATLNISSWLSVGRGNGTGTVSSVLILTNGATVIAQNCSAGFNGGNAANRPKGAIRLHGSSTLSLSGVLRVAESAGADMSVTVNDNSTLDVGGIMDLAIGFGPTLATLTVNGGNVNLASDPYIGHWGSGQAVLNLNGGSFNVGTTATKWMFMGYWDWVNSTVNVNGGSLKLWNNSSLKMARNNNHAGNAFTHVINHNSGNVTYYSDAGVTPGGIGNLDLQYTGGSNGVSLYHLNGGVLTVPTIISSATTGTRVFNFNGGTLRAAADSVTLLNLGAGNAHAYVRAGGAVIDTDGKNVTIASALEHFPGDPTDGGLRKRGAGTLTLTATNTYDGNTVVEAGTLQLAVDSLASGSTVSISNSATLQLDFATTNQVAGLVLAGVPQPAGVYNNLNAPAFITGAGSLLVNPIAGYATNITVTAGGGLIGVSWPGTHLGWILQTQTNSAATGLSTNWVDVPGSAAVTNISFPVNPANPAVFYRLRKP
ncbi:MAG: beta strand repeat-containing protein [Limisphaerales bacterium]